MPAAVQHIVVSNLATGKPRHARQVFRTGLVAAGALLVCLLLWLILNAEIFLIGTGACGVVLLIVAVLNRGDRQKSNRFICYTDLHRVVHMEYSNPRNDPFKQVVRIQFPAAALLSYTLHTFFGGKPAMMHLQAKGPQGGYVLGPVPVEYLNKEQQADLFHFLDALTAPTQR